MRILVVEDDPSIGEPLVAGLARQGFEASLAATGAAALEGAPAADLVLLDLGLPDLDGTEVCRRIRENLAVPIIVISARSEEIDRVLLLESGADDYLVKPFGLRELVARIRAVARRMGEGDRPTPGVIEVAGLRIDARARRVSVDGADVELTPKEFDVLTTLAADPGAVVERRTILETVWDPHWYGSSKTLDVHVAALRRKLGDPSWIQTVRGVGFRLGAPAPGGERPG